MDKTVLDGRVLWYDGDTEVPNADSPLLIRHPSIKHVTEVTQPVIDYNKLVVAEDRLRQKTTCRPLDYRWNIPAPYNSLNVVEYVFRVHQVLFDHLEEAELQQREVRLASELQSLQERGLFQLIRAVIWIINTLSASNTIWGVGRGSSVASYVLYVIGVHDIDSYKYNLDISEFLHE